MLVELHHLKVQFHQNSIFVYHSNSVNSVIFLNHVTNNKNEHENYKDYLQTLIAKNNNELNERKGDCDKYDYWPDEDFKTTEKSHRSEQHSRQISSKYSILEII